MNNKLQPQIILVNSNSLVQIIFSRKSLVFKVEKWPLDDRSLGKTNIKQCKINCRFELDIGPGTAESAVESNSILDP